MFGWDFVDRMIFDRLIPGLLILSLVGCVVGSGFLLRAWIMAWVDRNPIRSRRWRPVINLGLSGVYLVGCLALSVWWGSRL